MAFGIALSKALRISKMEFVTNSIIGLFAITLLTSVWALFGSINIGFHIILSLLTFLFWWWNKLAFNSAVASTYKEIQSFSIPFRLLFVGFSILILAQSATLPFIYDNETYYIQTIKWLNEYGFVNGLGNLHLFLGQTSGWHITQSVYSFSFLSERFNDLNGFCLLLVNFFAFQKLHSYFKNGNHIDLLFGLLPFTYAFLFQFISAPSPDFPIYLFAFMIFSMYLQNSVEGRKTTFIIITVMALFAFYIKITAVVLLLFPIVLLVKHFHHLKKQIIPLTCLGGFVFLLWVLKNCVLTGYPLFPLLSGRMDDLDYTIPSEIMTFFFSKSMLNSFYIPNSAYDSASTLGLLKHYFLYNGLASYIGIISVFVLFITPFVIIKKHLSKSLWTIYAAFILLVILLCFSSPQYRFYVYFTLFFLLLILSLWINNSKWILRFYTMSLILVGVLILVPTSFGSMTDNDMLSKNSILHLKNIIIPEPNTKWQGEFKKTSIGNMSYHSPKDMSYFWLTGNGELPCVSGVQLEYFQQGFSFIPQQRSMDMKDGFFAQKVSNHE